MKIWDFNDQFDPEDEFFLVEDSDYHTTAICSLYENENNIITGNAGGTLSIFDLRL